MLGWWWFLVVFVKKFGRWLKPPFHLFRLLSRISPVFMWFFHIFRNFFALVQFLMRWHQTNCFSQVFLHSVMKCNPVRHASKFVSWYLGLFICTKNRDFSKRFDFCLTTLWSKMPWHFEKSRHWVLKRAETGFYL